MIDIKRVIGMDSIRFAMAAVVMLGHARIFNFDEVIIQHHPVLGIWNGIVNNLFPGKVAVIIFFVVSGFCIHFPYAAGGKLNTIEFYLRRMTRIGIPAFFALLMFPNTMHVIWSVICEMFYYLIYPFIWKFKGKELMYFFLLSFILSFSLSVFYSINNSYNGDFDRIGYYFDWLVGLPIWLLGVILADNFANHSNDLETSFTTLLLFRFFIWITAFICSFIRYHMQIGYAYSMPIFGILVYFWLKREIGFYNNKTENSLMSFGGKISYSIYLIHGGIFALVTEYFGLKRLGENVLIWCIGLVVSIICSIVFYYLVEKQSYRFAKAVKIG